MWLTERTANLRSYFLYYAPNSLQQKPTVYCIIIYKKANCFAFSSLLSECTVCFRGQKGGGEMRLWSDYETRPCSDSPQKQQGEERCCLVTGLYKSQRPSMTVAVMFVAALQWFIPGKHHGWNVTASSSSALPPIPPTILLWGKTWSWRCVVLVGKERQQWKNPGGKWWH